MATKVTKFAKGVNRGTATCSECGKRTWQNRIRDMGGDFKLCDTCFDNAGMENEHSDTGGDHNGRGPVPNECPVCRAEAEAAKNTPEMLPANSDATRYAVYVKNPTKGEWFLERADMTPNAAEILTHDLIGRGWLAEARMTVRG